ncbi:hypothetical protein RCL1_000014 [Eukaryota sp. TZLM3-RCL]
MFDLIFSVSYLDDSSPVRGLLPQPSSTKFHATSPTITSSPPIITRDELINSVISLLNDEDHEHSHLHPPIDALKSAADFFHDSTHFARAYVESCLVPFAGPCSPSLWKAFTSSFERPFSDNEFITINNTSKAINPNSGQLEDCFLISESNKYCIVKFNTTKITLPRGAVDFPVDDDRLIAVGLPCGTNPFSKLKDQAPIHKYWRSRFSLFSRFEEGIMTDRQGLFSITPEVIALHVAKRIRNFINDGLIIDCTACVGGNTISFAHSGKVLAVDIDIVKLNCLLSNSIIYDVSHNIDVLHGSCLEILSSFQLASTSPYCLYFAPEWAGPSYSNQAVFCAAQLVPSLISISIIVKKLCPRLLVLALPRNIAINTVVDFAKAISFKGTVEFEQNVVLGNIKTVHVYYWFDGCE